MPFRRGWRWGLAIGARRGAEARPLLTAARAAYAELEMTERVRQADDLLRVAR